MLEDVANEMCRGVKASAAKAKSDRILGKEKELSAPHANETRH